MSWSLIVTLERAKLWVVGPLQHHEDDQGGIPQSQGQYLSGGLREAVLLYLTTLVRISRGWFS